MPKGAAALSSLVPHRGTSSSSSLWKGLPWALGTTRPACLPPPPPSGSPSCCCRMRKYRPLRSWCRSSRRRRVRGSLGCSASRGTSPGPMPRAPGLQASGGGVWTAEPRGAVTLWGWGPPMGTEPPEGRQPQEPHFRRTATSSGSAGPPLSGSGGGARGHSQGIPRVLKGQLLQLSLRAELWCRQPGSLPAGAAEPSPSLLKARCPWSGRRSWRRCASSCGSRSRRWR